MNRLDFDAINARLDAGTLVPQWLPDGKKQGHEWVARNPTRNDTRPGSFAINLVTGKWADFATGDEGGDLVSLYAYLFHANDNGKAARELADREGIQLDADTRQEAAEKISQIKDHQPQVITPVPDDAPQPNFNHFKHGQPSRVWPYYDTQGRLLLFVCRFDHQDGSKDVVPFSWCEHPGKGARWTWRGITGSAKRPLYGQDRLAAMPDADVVLEGAVIDPNNKDTIINAVSHWLVELGELDATFRKADIARLKSFVTTARDKLRQPYDRKPSEYQRRTVFFASVNEDRYLVDDTGNRRWWSVPVTGVNYQHQLDMQQVWAELLTHYERGEQWWLTADEQDALNQLNTEHEAVDPVEEMVQQHFDWDRAGMGDDMTASEVLVAIGFDRPNRAQATHASKVLQKMTSGKPRKVGSRRVFTMPPRISQAGGYTAYGDRPF